jgi:hypothetical protein
MSALDEELQTLLNLCSDGSFQRCNQDDDMWPAEMSRNIVETQRRHATAAAGDVVENDRDYDGGSKSNPAPFALFHDGRREQRGAHERESISKNAQESHDETRPCPSSDTENDERGASRPGYTSFCIWMHIRASSPRQRCEFLYHYDSPSVLQCHAEWLRHVSVTVTFLTKITFLDTGINST